MVELKTLDCPFCGKTFTQETYKQKYCSTKCRSGVNNRKKTLRKAMKRTEKKSGISELRRLAIEARKHGMTYGQYVAMKGV